MRLPLRLLSYNRASGALAVRCFASSAIPPSGRTAPYRRLGGELYDTSNRPSSLLYSQLLSLSFRKHPSASLRLGASPSLSRVFASTFFESQDQRRGEKIRDHPRSQGAARDKIREEKAEPSSKSSSGRSSTDKAEEPASETAEEHSSKKSEESSKGQQQSRRNKENAEKEKEEPPPPPHGDKTPWRVFTETLKSEFQASKEWNESTKALASSAHQFSENDSVKRARAAYSAASGAATSTTSSALRGTGKVLGQGAAWTWDTPVVKGVRTGVRATGRGIEKATRPVRETTVYKTTVGGVKDVIDDGSSSRYGGWVEKEERRRQRELRELHEAAVGNRLGRKEEKIEEDPNAGTNVTLHTDASWKESWREFKESNRVIQSLFSLKSSYNESENPLVSTARSITDRVAGFFAENEIATVIKKFHEMDHSFKVEDFLRELGEYILPEVLDAYVKGDTNTLKLWLSPPQFQVYAALAQQVTTAGLKSDGRILDIRHVVMLTARMIEQEIPVCIISARTQEVHVYRDLKTNQLAAGMEDKVQLVRYSIAVTRVAGDVNNPDTRGWRILELQRFATDYI